MYVQPFYAGQCRSPLNFTDEIQQTAGIAFRNDFNGPIIAVPDIAAKTESGSGVPDIIAETYALDPAVHDDVNRLRRHASPYTTIEITE